MSSPSEIVEFLKARLDEDEERLDAIDHIQAPAGHMARERREVEAKRRIIAEYERFAAERRRAMNGWDTSEISPILAALALPYADHPDYDESWRP